MKSTIITTKDGSKTIHFTDWNESYHSKHGAIQEALHVYIDAGLRYKTSISSNTKLSVFEVGFGTGLNALLSLLFSIDNKIQLKYHTIEKYPLEVNTLRKLNYSQLLRIDQNIFYKLHQVSWEKLHKINPFFWLSKYKADLLNFCHKEKYDIIFFDAFGPRVQSELWEMDVFKKLYNFINQDGILVTYCCKGRVRRILENLGFKVEKIPGPPGKREMLRATKYTL